MHTKSLCYTCSQIPNTVVIGDNEHTYMLPMEVAWWFLRKSGVQPGEWILMLTPDLQLGLPAHTVARGPTPINIMVGCTRMRPIPVCLHLCSPVVPTPPVTPTFQKALLSVGHVIFLC